MVKFLSLALGSILLVSVCFAQSENLQLTVNQIEEKYLGKEGIFNIFIGWNTGMKNKTGHHNIYIGTEVNAPDGDENNMLRIGHYEKGIPSGFVHTLTDEEYAEIYDALTTFIEEMPHCETPQTIQ